MRVRFRYEIAEDVILYSHALKNAFKAVTYEAPYEILDSSFAELSADLEYDHWFGHCTPGGCNSCTNDQLLTAGTAWADTFVVGDVCVLTDGEGNIVASDNDDVHFNI